MAIQFEHAGDLPAPVRAAIAEMEKAIARQDWTLFSTKKLEILKVFLRVAAAQGYAAVTMRGLGAELNLKAPSIYSHFPGGKEEIIAHSLRWQGALFGHAMLEATKDAQDVRGFLDALVRGHCGMNLQNRENNLWDMIVAADRVGRFLPEELRSEMTDWLRICTRLYSSAGEALGVAEAGLKARQMMVMIDGVHSWADWDGSDAQRAAILDQAAAFCRTMMIP
ncbi:TetR/AcrR family transcriptional regulator [Poseidonocella sp. HB161398]|uniref:TetR/AcrR family transcriptional regulator n=1 Tax=Poseidonocella sp. HB161398 TaxID=2320855 RepID=UPI001486424A|nr:TetR/AcrR family transcriptional regulator [Poseidonocella sp. HB161398]